MLSVLPLQQHKTSFHNLLKKKKKKNQVFKIFIFPGITTEEWREEGEYPKKTSKLTPIPSVTAGIVQLSSYFHPVSCFFHSLQFILKKRGGKKIKVNAHMLTCYILHLISSGPLRKQNQFCNIIPHTFSVAYQN